MSKTLTFKGLDETKKRIEQLNGKIRKTAIGALFVEAEIIMTISKRDYVPVKDSPLMNSGHVDEPEDLGKVIKVSLNFGGPAAPYAVLQHENLAFQHLEKGEAKYLEKPLFERAPKVSGNIAKRVRNAMST